MTDEELKRLMQEAGFVNGRGFAHAEGTLDNFRRFADLIRELERKED